MLYNDIYRILGIYMKRFSVGEDEISVIFNLLAQ